MQKFKLLKGELPVAPMPETLQPKGLDLARRQYLHRRSESSAVLAPRIWCVHLLILSRRLLEMSGCSLNM